MDAKGRLAIPARVREELVDDCKGRLVVTAHHQEPCLLAYPEPHWQQLLPQIEAMPNINRRARQIQRALLGYATPLELDSNGRILLPPTLRNHAGLEKDIMLVGLGRKLEIWSEPRFHSWMNEVSEDDELPPEALTLNL